ncbi:MAG: J domain-containing protein [Thermoplasmatota archaeon]
MEVDYYSLLGVSPYSTRSEIKIAYRRMAEVYHPDKLRELPQAVREEGESIMRLLNEAKTILLDPDKRYLYDLRRGHRGSREDAIIVKEFDQAVAYEPEYVIALEKEEVSSRMARVLSGLREVFVKDKDFQNKIAIAQEIVEAKVIEEPRFKVKTIEMEGDDEFNVVIDGEPEIMERSAARRSKVELEDDEEEVEMTLEFARVKVDVEKVSAPPKRKRKNRSFKVVAVEGDDEESEELEEFEVQEVEWEE